MRRIVPIVEGHSEAESIPAFVRRILHEYGIFDIKVDRPIREHRQRLVKRDVFANKVRMARLRDDCAGVLVVFDADDDAACEVGPRLCDWARSLGIETPTCVILAVRELESWLVAGIDSLWGFRGVPRDVSPPDHAEAIRGAKEWLDHRMTTGYKETIDQLPLLQRLDYEVARRRAPSLDKFIRAIRSLASDAAG